MSSERQEDWHLTSRMWAGVRCFGICPDIKKGEAYSAGQLYRCGLDPSEHMNHANLCHGWNFFSFGEAYHRWFSGFQLYVCVAFGTAQKNMLLYNSMLLPLYCVLYCNFLYLLIALRAISSSLVGHLFPRGPCSKLLSFVSMSWKIKQLKLGAWQCLISATCSPLKDEHQSYVPSATLTLNVEISYFAVACWQMLLPIYRTWTTHMWISVWLRFAIFFSHTNSMNFLVWLTGVGAHCQQSDHGLCHWQRWTSVWVC